MKKCEKLAKTGDAFAAPSGPSMDTNNEDGSHFNGNQQLQNYGYAFGQPPLGWYGQLQTDYRQPGLYNQIPFYAYGQSQFNDPYFNYYNRPHLRMYGKK